MNKKALFCDGTSQYVNPSEPERNEKVAFRFRTAKDDAECQSEWCQTMIM